MLNSKTVFILGAGASFEVGFPLGSELRKQISTKLDINFDRYSDSTHKGDLKIYSRLAQTYSNKLNDIANACWHIRDGIILSDSIDDFIDSHQDNECIKICGKIAIAHSILEAEKNSSLYVDPRNTYNSINFSSVEDTWYSKFYRLLTKQLPKTNLEDVFNNVIVVNFNYDRSLEHFLLHAFYKHYNVSKEEAKYLVDKLTVYRPYGSIGNYVSFGSNSYPTTEDILTNLRTYTEKVSDTEGLKQVHNAMQEAEVFVFLGMAFHPNNINLLRSDLKYKPKSVFLTRKGISNSDMQLIYSRINNMLDSQLQTTENLLSTEAIYNESNKTPSKMFIAQECRDLFDEYRLSLSEL